MTRTASHVDPPRTMLDEPHHVVSPASLAFIIYREGLGPIFSSVYLAPAMQLMQRQHDVRLVTLSALGEWVRRGPRQAWESLRRTLDSRLTDRLYRLPAPPARFRSAWSEAALLRRWLRRNCSEDRPTILHCGASEATVLALEARRVMPHLKVVYQVWGPEAAEYTFDRGQRLDAAPSRPVQREASRRDALQRRAMCEADAVISISAAMTHWAVEEFGCDRQRVTEVPCFVDTERFNVTPASREGIRSRLGLSDQFVVVYVGSMFRWQFPDRCLDVLNAIMTARPNAYFLAVTTSPARMQARLQEAQFPLNRATICRAHYDDVPNYLAAGDLAILGRNLGEPWSLINAVSSPVKFGEYLACGVPVVLSEGVGDFSAAAKQAQLGLVVPHNSNAADVRTLTERFLSESDNYEADLRRRCRQYAIDHLSLKVHIPRLSALYNSLAARPQ